MTDGGHGRTVVLATYEREKFQMFQNKLHFQPIPIATFVLSVVCNVIYCLLWPNGARYACGVCIEIEVE